MYAKNPAMLENWGDYLQTSNIQPRTAPAAAHGPHTPYQALRHGQPIRHSRGRSNWCPTPWLSFSLCKMEAATPNPELQRAQH